MPDKIIATQMQRDNAADSDDQVKIAFDTFFRQRDGYFFTVKPVQIKTLTAGFVNFCIARGVGHSLPVTIIPAAFALGFLSYGLSIVFDVLALRDLGAAREAAFFATAPFIGAIAAVTIVGEPLRSNDLGAAAVMTAGVTIMIVGRGREAEVS